MTIGLWRMISLGRKCFEFHVDFSKDICTVWATSIVNLNPGMLRISQMDEGLQLAHSTTNRYTNLDTLDGTPTRISTRHDTF